MAKRLKDFRSGDKKLYSVPREQVPCSVCCHQWMPGKFPLRLSRQEWSQVPHWFLQRLPVVAIIQETGIEPKPVLPALPLCSSGLPDRDIPHLFSATVERDEPYLGPQWKNKRHPLKTGATKPGRGTCQRPVCGILRSDGKV